jgi:hypothetical protein
MHLIQASYLVLIVWKASNKGPGLTDCKITKGLSGELNVDDGV